MGVTKKVWLGSYRQTGAGSSSSKVWPKQVPARVAVAGCHEKGAETHSRGDNAEVTIHSRGVTGAATGGDIINAVPAAGVLLMLMSQSTAGM